MIAKQLLLFLILILTCSVPQSFSQNKVGALIDKYVDYVDAPREVAFAHLNKSVYVEGEMLGFQAYVFDKVSKERSMMTSNLYCTITDDVGNVIKEKLVLMLDGVANNEFNIDSTFTKNEYTFKAFTNYMLNFEEQNHFEQKFKIIYADKKDEVKLISNNAQIDLQLLPEGGHLITEVFNNVAVIAKNDLGEGISNTSISIVNQNSELISEFKLNEFGIGKTIFKPNMGDSYTLKLINENYDHQISITNIRPTGLALSLNEVQGKVILKISTNSNGLKSFGNRTFNLAVHNGGDINTIPFSLNNQIEAAIAFETNDLFSGINIFTLFDENNSPILERLYFNYEGVLTGDLNSDEITKKSDSISIRLNIKDFKTDTFSNLSVSALPQKTKSYNPNNNILSSIYIQPFIKGAIENGAYYFNDVNQKTKYNLDLLLLSQGWSSYKWERIFKGKPLLNYPFERGIDVVAHINGNKKSESYMVYPLINHNTEIFDLTNDNDKFHLVNFRPIEGEKINISGLKKNGSQEKPNLYLKFSPSQIPHNIQSIFQPILTENKVIEEDSFEFFSSGEGIALNEVVITGKKPSKKDELERIHYNSKITLISSSDRVSNIRLSIYLNKIGWVSEEYNGEFTIRNPRILRGPTTPLVFLDNAMLTDFSALQNMNIGVVDYIVSDLYGNGGMGIRGSAGFIKIYTDPFKIIEGMGLKNEVFTKPFPLTFANEQTFYTPVYKFYNTTFFNEYGVIGWKPNLKANDQGYVEFKIPNTGTSELSLFIEGVVNGNELISKQLNLSLD